MSQDLTAIYDTRVAEGLLRPDPAQRAILQHLEELRRDIETPRKTGFFARITASKAPAPHGMGLYLWGGVGRGKSMLMDLFFAHTDLAKKRRVHFHAFMQEIQTALHKARQSGVTDAIRPVADAIIRDTRLLCFDEMQITDITDAMIVGRLFEQLFAAGVVIVTTSNRAPQDLYKDGLNRALFLPFIALLEERLEVIELAAQIDYRQDRLAGAQVWFHPADETAQRAIDALWLELTHGRQEELTLTVKGREVRLTQFWAGVARTDFNDLCGKPLGPADYLALTGAVKVLILENVPRLGPEKFNEAKRFVTLVDTLYEAKTRLIVSAQETPEGIYQSGTGSFEFERTASRLREMQSADWGLAGQDAPKS